MKLREDSHEMPPWRQPRGKWMIYLVNSHTNATSKRWHLWEIDLRFALNSTPGWDMMRIASRDVRIALARGWVRMGRKGMSYPTNEATTPEARQPATQAAGLYRGTSLIRKRQLPLAREGARKAEEEAHQVLGGTHPGGNPGANIKSISHRCHPILVAFEWELTKEIIDLPLGCLQGGVSTREVLAGHRDAGASHLFQVVNHRPHFADDHPNLRRETSTGAISLRGTSPQGFAGAGMAARRRGGVLGGG